MGGIPVGSLDEDTKLSPDSFRAAKMAAGAVIAAVDSVVQNGAKNAFCVVRPPGHHAGPRGSVPNGNEPCCSNGFCLLNNVAIGAAYARAHYGRERFDPRTNTWVIRGEENNLRETLLKINLFNKKMKDINNKRQKGREGKGRNCTIYSKVRLIFQRSQ